MDDIWEPGTVYMRHKQGKSSHIEAHTCWNMSRFIVSANEACDKANKEAKKGEPKQSVSIVDVKAYNTERFSTRKE